MTSKWTTEMRKTIDELMNAECGGLWFESELTEQMLNNCCAKCPFRFCCEDDALCFGGSVWEESMGEDL